MEAAIADPACPDFSVLCGFRCQHDQEAAYEKGNSKLRWPRSKHNELPSRAVDIAPYPIDWQNHGRFIKLAGHIMRIAEEQGVWLRWGGDWDGDGDWRDERFSDKPHFELK